MHDQVRITACVAVLNSPLPLRSLNAPNFFFCPYLKTASLTFLKVNVNIQEYSIHVTIPPAVGEHGFYHEDGIVLD